MKSGLRVATRIACFFYFALCILHFALATFSSAAESWSLTTVDFKTERAEVTAIDNTGVHLAADGQSRVIPFEQVVQIDRPAAVVVAAGRFTLQLAGGDRLAGEPAGVIDEKLHWKDVIFGEITIALKDMRSIIANGPSSSASTPAETSAEDVVRLTNGDSLRGILSDISAASVVIRPTGADPATVPLDSVRAIELAAAPGAAVTPNASGPRMFRIALLGGSIVTVPSITLAGDSVRFDLLGQARQVLIASVRSIEQVNGPVVWLSSIEPTENIQTPYLGPTTPARMNATARGMPILFGSRTYPHGVGVHSYSRLTWPVDPRFKTFRTQYALDGDLPYADVTLRITLDDKIGYELANFTAGKISPVIALDLGSAKSITLEVDYGQNYDVQDRLNWIEPAFLTTVGP